MLQLKPNMNYESICPACQNPISFHSDSSFQAERIAEVDAAQSKKRQKVIPVAQAAKLVRQGKLCESLGCSSVPSFNHPLQAKTRYCSSHKEDGMVNIKAVICENEDCDKSANYNTEGEKVGSFCASHMKSGMINVKAQLCKAEGCSKIPSYNFPSETRPVNCKQHMQDGMVDVKHPTCEVEGCPTRPHYNFPGHKRGRFCASHKEEGMVSQDWVGKGGAKPSYKKYMKKCEQQDCGVQANFNTPGEKKARFCASHKDEGMKNVHERARCGVDMCQKHPYFNYRGEKKGLFCNEHKAEGMLNVYSSKCEVGGCDRGAHFLLEGEGRVRRCSTHKEQNMRPAAKKRPRCQAEQCEKRPTFFFAGLDAAARFCLSHKEDGMVSRNSVAKRPPEMDSIGI